MLKEAGGDTFESLAPDAQTADLDGIPVRYASLTALLRMKRAANRPKDRDGIRLAQASIATAHARNLLIATNVCSSSSVPRRPAMVSEAAG